MNDIVMPKLSDTMTEGRLVSWKKRVGDQVSRGEVLAEVETDKANMELEAFTNGVLLEIRVQAGEMVQVGTVIAVIGSAEERATSAAGQPPATPAEPAAQPGEVLQGPPAEAAPAKPAGGAEPPVAAAPQETPAKVQLATEGQAPSEVQLPAESQIAAAPEAPGEAVALSQEQAQAKAQAQVETKGGGQGETLTSTQPLQKGPVAPEGAAPVERAAPVVRRRARELGVDLGQVHGSGPEGRILLKDLEEFAAGTPGAQAPVQGGGPSGAAEPPSAAAGAAPQDEGLSRLRAAVAKTVSESWRTIPHFSVTVDVFMDQAEALRRQLKESGVPLTLNDLIVKGTALALLKYPRLNASFNGDSLELHRQVNIGIAVGVPDGVLIPVIVDCQSRTLQQIAEESRGLVEHARSGSLSEHDLSGGTFSVSNLGMFGVSQFNAIIFPRQAGVLAVGAVTDVVAPRGGVPVCLRSMKLTLSADHRVVDGAYAAEFLADLKEILESPVRLLI
ncbi:dihydrolipoamide acetyltransferase component of pyruvate dehydrogenase complex [Geomonas silvestris]|uniref:Dihydrolipoamide acetyltransferase component of pyruvate dehydrogenase complex n=1 Tax=Geomonas silvestris TaxID=2740184 RepID=A0A6V8MNC5_9BACT|nr:dihydrolipoamide acetyltransferase family protein [Geomonas silvestris]GFO61482.1 dihydrolipoamide acetyltransferase component of pyruvate dehydrogenase complex [Geomonas silvestris]